MLETLVIGAALLSAVLHAGWNAMVKLDDDRLVSFVLLHLCLAIVALVLMPFFPFPSVDVWQWIGVNAALHFMASICLLGAYQTGPFGRIYPIARGIVPLLVTLWVFCLWGDLPASQDLYAIALLVAGIAGLSLFNLVGAAIPVRSLGYAAACAVCISLYTVVDSHVAKTSAEFGSYIIWLMIVDAIPMYLLVAVKRRGSVLSTLQQKWRVGLSSGVVALSAYWLYMWALSQGSVVMVSALRETSVVFALVISGVVLKERLGWRDVLSVIAVAAGVMLLK